MNGNYPPNVTGNEPQIVGSEAEDKCAWCRENYDGEIHLSSLRDGIIEVHGELVCEECLDEHLAAEGISLSDIKRFAEEEFCKRTKIYLMKHDELPVSLGAQRREKALRKDVAVKGHYKCIQCGCPSDYRLCSNCRGS